MTATASMVKGRQVDATTVALVVASVLATVSLVPFPVVTVCAAVGWFASATLHVHLRYDLSRLQHPVVVVWWLSTVMAFVSVLSALIALETPLDVRLLAVTAVAYTGLLWTALVDRRPRASVDQAVASAGDLRERRLLVLTGVVGLALSIAATGYLLVRAGGTPFTDDNPEETRTALEAGNGVVGSFSFAGSLLGSACLALVVSTLPRRPARRAVLGSAAAVTLVALACGLIVLTGTRVHALRVLLVVAVVVAVALWRRVPWPLLSDSVCCRF